MTPNPLYLETGLYSLLLCTLNTHKYLLAREGGQTPCQNKQELKLGTLTMSTGDPDSLNIFRIDAELH
jgi:hypothetical protein